MSVFRIVTIAGLCLFLCSDAVAQRKRGGGRRLAAIFKKLDTNNDGKISKAEAKGSRLEKAFDKIDKNSDGNITKAELAAGRKSRRGGKRRRKRGKRGGK